MCSVGCVWCPSVCWTGIPADIGRRMVCVCVVLGVFGVLLSVGLAYQLREVCVCRIVPNSILIVKCWTA